MQSKGSPRLERFQRSGRDILQRRETIGVSSHFPRPYHPGTPYKPPRWRSFPRSDLTASPYFSPRHPAVAQGCCGFAVSWNSGTRKMNTGTKFPPHPGGAVRLVPPACGAWPRSSHGDPAGWLDRVCLQAEPMRQHRRCRRIASEGDYTGRSVPEPFTPQRQGTPPISKPIVPDELRMDGDAQRPPHHPDAAFRRGCLGPRAP